MSKSIAIWILVLLMIGSLLMFVADIMDQAMICMRQYDFKRIIIDVWRGKGGNNKLSMRLSSMNINLIITRRAKKKCKTLLLP